ncbi:hypothetical protein K443DRAFT_126434, partial [Laccaria amethystina LaAM-08-1]
LVPSQAAIYQFLLSTDDAVERAAPSKFPEGIEGASIQEIKNFASFLNEALYIQSLQRKIIALVVKQEACPSKTTENEISDRRRKLSSRIDKWCSIQAQLIPQVADDVGRQCIAGKITDRPEKAVLFIPSDYGIEGVNRLGFVSLGQVERKLREGAAFDAIWLIQNIVKTISALTWDGKQNASGQVATTHARAKIVDAEFRRDLAIAAYNASRDAMISLGLPKDDQSFPSLSLSDTFRQPTHLKRKIGDSRLSDGHIWTTGVNGGRRNTAPSLHGSDSQTGESSTDELAVEKKCKEGHSLKGAKRQIRKTSPNQAPAVNVSDALAVGKAAPTPRKDGWIWSLGTMGTLSERDLRDWAEEGDRVQWFRAEAEMERWQEEWERKQAEFMRCIRSYDKMSDVWAELSKSSPSQGHAAYARKKSAMFSRMKQIAQAKFNSAGYTNRVLQDRQILADLIQQDRQMDGQGLEDVLSNIQLRQSTTPPLYWTRATAVI